MTDPYQFAALLRARARYPYVTWVVIGVNCLLFLVTAVAAGSLFSFGSETLLRMGALAAPRVQAGEWWRLLAAMFLHGGALHLAFNMLAMYQAGLLVERLYGNAVFAAIYLLAGLAGGCASIFWRQDVVSVGASGAVFGVYGALLAYLLLQRGSIPAEVLRQLRVSTTLFVGYSMVIGLGQGNIDNAAHLGGLAGGVIVGAAAARPLDRRWSTGWLARSAAGCLLVALLGTALLLMTPQPRADSTQALNLALVDVARTDDEVDRRLAELRLRIERGEIDAERARAVLARDITPLWDSNLKRLSELRGPRPQLEELRLSLFDYARQRRAAAHDMVQALIDEDAGKLAAIRREQLLGQQSILDKVRKAQPVPGAR